MAKLRLLMCLFAGISLGCASDVENASDLCQSLLPCEMNGSEPIHSSRDGAFDTLDFGVQDAETSSDLKVASDQGHIDMALDARWDSWVAPCQPTEVQLADSSDWSREGIISVGRSAYAGEIISMNLDADRDEIPEFLVASEGRLNLYDTSGRIQWRTGVLGVQRLQAVTDLDGDGSLEIVATGSRSMVVVAGLTGQTLWQMPRNPFESGPLSNIGKVMVSDIDGDGLEELYVTNGGCGDAGNGAGLIYRYSAGVMTRIVEIVGERLNGRCASWQTLFDTDGDGTKELLVPDGNGLNAFSTTSGRKTICGGHAAPTNGPNPIVYFDTPNGPAWLTLAEDTIHRLEIQPSQDCEGGRTFASVWQTQLNGIVLLGGSGFGTNEQGVATRFYLSIRANDGSTNVWSVDLETGDPLKILDQQRLLATLSNEGPLTTRLLTQASTTGRESQLMLSASIGGEWQTIREMNRRDPKVINEASDERSSGDIKRTYTFNDTNYESPSFVLSSAILDGWERRIERLSLEGETLQVLEPTLSGDLIVQCGTRAPCDSSRSQGLQGIDANGAILTLDLAMGRSSEEHFTVRTGNAMPIPIEADPTLLGVMSDNGTLASFRTDGRNFERIWEQPLGAPERGQSFALAIHTAEGPVLVARDTRYGESAWSAFEAETGDKLWTHALSDREARVINNPVAADGSNAAFVRMDYSKDNLIPEDPSCPVMDNLPADFFTPQPNCPDKEIRWRVVTALEPMTGACLWRRVFKSQYPANTNGEFFGCPGPSNQRLSIVPATLNSPLTGFVTESMTLRTFSIHSVPPDIWLAPFLDSYLFGKTERGTNIGGGEVTRLNGGYLLSGGATPPMHFSENLSLIWGAPDPGSPRSQSWNYRQSVSLGPWVWTSSAGGYPLMKLDAMSGNIVQLLGLQNGEMTPIDVFEPNWPAITQITPMSSPDGELVSVVTDEGLIYMLDADGALHSTYRSDVPVLNLRSIGNTTQERLLHATGGGRIISLRRAFAAGPEDIFDVACPATATCAPESDIDETNVVDRLCFAWTPVADVVGYEIGLENIDGAMITAWQQVGIESRATIDNLSLTPGQRYFAVVRALFSTSNTIRTSSIKRSDGILIVNPSPPTLSVNATRLSSERLRLDIEAQDDDRLATWRIDAINPESGQLVERIGSGPLGSATWRQTFEISLSRFSNQAPPIEAIDIVVRVTDRSANFAEAAHRAPITVAD